MRRPHPRFDQRRNAWVTNAGGKLKTLAKGPKNSATEAEAWDEFYAYMATLGRPVEEAPVPEITLGELSDEYAEWMVREVADGRMKVSGRRSRSFRESITNDGHGEPDPSAGVETWRPVL